MTNVFIRNWRLISFVLGIIAVVLILYFFRTVILPFAVGLILAYLLMPIVRWLETRLPPRNKWPSFKRVLSILIAFLLLLCIVGALAYFVVTAVIDASMVLLESTPSIIGRGAYQVQQWFVGIIDKLPEELQQEVSNGLVEGGIDVGKYIRDMMSKAISFIPNTFSMILGFAVLPFFLFYIMKDSERLKKGFTSAVSPTIAEHSQNLALIIERVLGNYIRAQIMLGVIVAYFSFIGLLLLKVPFSLALAIIAGVMEMVPTLGPWIGGALAVIVALALVPEKALWVAVLYVGIQLVENNLLVPKVQSAYLHIHPAIMIFLLIFGAYIAGFWGLLMAGPLTATIVEVVKYLRNYYKTRSTTEPAASGQAAV